MPFLDRVPVRLRLATLLLAAVVAAAVTAAQVAPLGPRVDAHVLSHYHDGEADYHGLYMTARGGEPIGLVRVEAETDGVEVVGWHEFRDVPSGFRFETRVKVRHGGIRDEYVRVVIAGREDEAQSLRIVGRDGPP